MYKIEPREFGYYLTFGEVFNENESRLWLEESKSVLSKGPNSFGVFVDMRTLQPMSFPAQRILEKGQRYYKETGMTRSVVIVDSPILKRQLEDLAKESGIYDWERYVATSVCSDWEQVGLEWIINAVDPDKTKTPAPAPAP
ncbi:MAG: hypothetical protein P1R58_09175 [bacterium]|nr:hypothetical protein [bacterium]